jgi:uncharacterized protein
MSYYINYPKLIDDALHGVVRGVLGVVAEEGLKDGHHFFISFLTQARGVQLSSREKHFSLCLSFDGISETVVVPYKAMTSFSDPHAKTSLQFRYYAEQEEDKNTEDAKEEAYFCPNAIESSNVIPLDKFRKSNNKS